MQNNVQPIDPGFVAEFPAVAAALAKLDGRPLPEPLHPLAAVVDADASAYDPDAGRARGLVTVADAERINAAHEDADLMRVDAPQVSRCDALDSQCGGAYCQDPQERVHYGPEHALRVSFVDEPLLPFELAQWDGEQPHLSFFADGSWPALDVAQVDELLLALDRYTGALRVAREHLARALDGQVARRGDA
ncbi:hypothetical protein GCM10009535_40190 [Streptomyces thermocarboxydovorans]|uniref:Uncharacterized protein n=1 Tax=Streptomyces thermocarboxydovorans TaxID=59298 RepID=A0ABN1HL02_9ACTN